MKKNEIVNQWIQRTRSNLARTNQQEIHCDGMDHE